MTQIRLLFAGALLASAGFAAGPSIGLAVANGTFHIDKSEVYGNSAVVDGSLIETAAASSEVALRSGARLRLGPESQACVHADRLVLEKGRGELSSGSGYFIEALGLRVGPESPQSRFAVSYSGAGRIEVAALFGGARVTGAGGVLIARAPSGTALDLEPQAAGAATPSNLVGELERRDGAFVLTDEVSHVTYTVAGSGLDGYVGKRVEVTGDIEPAARAGAGSLQVIHVLKIHELAQTARKGRFLHNPKVIVGGVAVAAAGAAVGIGVTQGGGKSSISQ